MLVILTRSFVIFCANYLHLEEYAYIIYTKKEREIYYEKINGISGRYNGYRFLHGRNGITYY